MSGSPIQQVQKAIEYMHSSVDDTVCDFILYDDKAVRVKFEEAKSCKIGGMYMVCMTVVMIGMTSFCAALKCIRQYITESANKETSGALGVVFMTDGCDTCAKADELERECQQFKFFVNTHCAMASKSKKGFNNITVHTLGFGTSHSAKFLERLRLIGSVEGTYRYAEGTSLNEKFSEMFDFLLTTGSVKMSFDGTQFIDVEYDKEDETFKFDAFFNARDVKDEVHDRMVCGQNIVIHVMTTKGTVLMSTLKPESVDNFFHLRELESIVITSKDELDTIQRELSSINPMSFPKDVRKDALDLRCAVQCKLDEYHALYSEMARGTITDGTVAAKLQSLRYETKFAKARRKRAMDRRVAGNAGRMMEIDEKLSVLDIDYDAIAADPDVSNLVCPLTGLNVIDILKASNTDVVVFPLRVSRAEFTLEAPSEIIVMDVLHGTYSFDSVNVRISSCVC